jgi:sulfite reductase alpha subunit-like flavoprotein
MPDDVADALISVFISEGGISKDEAKQYLDDMTKSNRFQKETW